MKAFSDCTYLEAISPKDVVRIEDDYARYNCVFIPTAGIGSRLNKKTKYLNKSLVSINNKPIIAHIIDKLPKSIKFVIALGYKGELVKVFKYCLSDRKFIYTKVWPYEGADSGLGLTLLQSQHVLNEPFIFWACDSIIYDFENNELNSKQNWIGYLKTNQKIILILGNRKMNS